MNEIDFINFYIYPDSSPEDTMRDIGLVFRRTHQNLRIHSVMTDAFTESFFIHLWAIGGGPTFYFDPDDPYRIILKFIVIQGYIGEHLIPASFFVEFIATDDSQLELIKKVCVEKKYPKGEWGNYF